MAAQMQLPAAAAPGAASVTLLTRLSEKRVGRTLFEYVFQVTVKNGTEPQTGVIVALTGAGPGTTIVDGAVDVGELAPRATVTPDDTITLRHDRALPFAANALVWLVSSGNLFKISDYTLVSSTLVGGTVFEDTFRATVHNLGAGDANIGARLTGTPPGSTIVEGTLAFGAVPRGASAESADTFVVRSDHAIPFDASQWVWSFQAVPLPPTAFELIDKAQAARLIDAETALVYKVFVEFNDERLPAAYRGRDDGIREAQALDEVNDRFQALLPATQQLLAPFLLQPNVPGSWYDKRASQRAAAGIGAPRETLQSTPARRAAAGSLAVTWLNLDTANGKVRIWWDAAKLDGNQASEIAAEIDTVIWPKLTGLLGEPLPDTDNLLQQPDGSVIPDETDDARLDIFLTDSARVYTAVRAACQAGVQAAFINMGVHRSYSSVVHELTHAILFRFKVKTGCDRSQYRWLGEATAEWAMHYVYPKANEEHPSARHFLDKPELPLDYAEPAGPAFFKHPYGAYLWWLYITRGADATRGGVAAAHYVRDTWEAAFNNTSLGAIEVAIGSLGGFRGEWPQFVLYNWNGKAKFTWNQEGEGKPYRQYATWDKLNRGAKEETETPIEPRLNGKPSAKYPLTHTIPHLASRYFHYDFRADNSIRRITFTHPYWSGDEPTARVQAIVKIKGQEWKAAEDWTDMAKKSLCRDKPAEDVEELVIVISNSEFKNLNHVLSDVANLVDPAELKVSALGCNPWIGSVQFNYTEKFDEPGSRITVTETASVSNVVFELVDGDEDGATYKATGGVVNWRHTGTASLGFGTLQCAGEAAGAFLVSAGFSTLDVWKLSPPLGDDSTLLYGGKGVVSNYPQQIVEPIYYACNNGARYPPTNQLRFLNWLETNPPIHPPILPEIYHKVTPDNGVLVMSGNSKFGKDGQYTWRWDLKQKRNGP